MFTPAHFAFGRIGIDAIYVIPFILIWLYAVLEFIDKDRPAAIALAAAALGAGVYSTPAAPLTMIFLWITMMVALWVAGRDELLRTHPASPVPADRRAAYPGADVAPYAPA